jgi:DNA-directed RNA polymerase subunit RPC12/RpoP
MPDIHFDCPMCAQTIDAPEELATQLIECPTCKERIEVPARSQLSSSWKTEYAAKPPPPPEPPPPPPTPAPATPQKFELPPIEDSAVSGFLTFIAALELIASPIAGLVIGSDYHGDTVTGWLVFLSGVISGMMLLGFARVIQNTFESAQRLKRLEMLMERDYDKKRAA